MIILTGYIFCIFSCSNEKTKEDNIPNIIENTELQKFETILTLNVSNLYLNPPMPSGYYIPTGFNKYILGEEGITHLDEILNLKDIVNLTKEGLRVLRNAVYAKYGYQFKSTELLDYFNQFNWYNAEFINVDDRLTEVDIKNIYLIKSVEENYPKNHCDIIGNYGDWKPGVPHGLSNEGPNRFYIYPNGIFKSVWSRYFGWDWDLVDIGVAKNYSEWKKNDYSFDCIYFGLWNYDNNILLFDGEMIKIGKASGIIWESETGGRISDNKEHIFIDNMWYYYSSDYN